VQKEQAQLQVAEPQLFESPTIQQLLQGPGVVGVARGVVGGVVGGVGVGVLQAESPTQSEQLQGQSPVPQSSPKRLSKLQQSQIGGVGVGVGHSF